MNAVTWVWLILMWVCFTGLVYAGRRLKRSYEALFVVQRRHIAFLKSECRRLTAAAGGDPDAVFRDVGKEHDGEPD